MRPHSASFKAVSSFPWPPSSSGRQTSPGVLFLIHPHSAPAIWPVNTSPRETGRQGCWGGQAKSWLAPPVWYSRQVHSTPTLGFSPRPTKGCVVVTSEPLLEACSFTFLLGSMLLLAIMGWGWDPPGSQDRFCPHLTLRSVGLRRGSHTRV